MDHCWHLLFSFSATTVSTFHTCHTHAHTRLTALCPGLPWWAHTRKVKPIWILLKQETVGGSGTSWAICKSSPRSRQITMPAPHHSDFYRPDALPAAQPTASKHWRELLRLLNLFASKVNEWCLHRMAPEVIACETTTEEPYTCSADIWSLGLIICCSLLLLFVLCGCQLFYSFFLQDWLHSLPWVLWRCWLGGRKGIRPVKNWVVRCWHGYLSGARCRLADVAATHCLLLQ